MHSLILFASGQGTNVAAIIEHFRDCPQTQISLIVCNKSQAGVLNIAESENIPSLLIDKEAFHSPFFLEKIKSFNPSLLVLAGFLWKIPDHIVEYFPQKIINIHPALLPKYGGKGMYGNLVHEAVKNAAEKESGMTIHYVNEHYDEGAIILQAKCTIGEQDNTEQIAGKIHQLEHFFYPRTIEFLLQSR